MESRPYDLFLDDLREVDWVFPPSQMTLSCKGQKVYERKDWNWIVCRSYGQAVQTVIDLGTPRMMTLDHDLGDEKTGKDFLNKIIQMDLDGFINLSLVERFTVHSSNIPGRENMLSLWTNFMKEKYGYQFI